MDLENQNDGQPADTSTDASTAPENNATPEENTPPKAEETLLAGKYKAVEDLEKGYKESTKYGREQAAKVKALESSVPKAPENYEFNFEGVEGLEGVELSASDPDIAGMLPVFKELNLTNEQASKLIEAHWKNMASLTETPEQIKAKLGSNADVIVTKLQEFSDGLPLEDQQIVQNLTDTAEGTDFLYRHLIGGELPTPGPIGDNSAAPVSSAELLTKAFNYKKEKARSLGHSPSEQAEYKKLMHAAIIAEENEKKVRK